MRRGRWEHWPLPQALRSAQLQRGAAPGPEGAGLAVPLLGFSCCPVYLRMQHGHLGVPPLAGRLVLRLPPCGRQHFQSWGTLRHLCRSFSRHCCARCAAGNAPRRTAFHRTAALTLSPPGSRSWSVLGSRGRPCAACPASRAARAARRGSQLMGVWVPEGVAHPVERRLRRPATKLGEALSAESQPSPDRSLNRFCRQCAST